MRAMMLFQILDLGHLTYSRLGIEMLDSLNMSGTSETPYPLDKGCEVSISHKSYKRIKGYAQIISYQMKFQLSYNLPCVARQHN